MLETQVRLLFRKKVWTSLKVMLTGAVLIYLGILSWYGVGWLLGIVVGIPGVIVYLIGINIGLTKISLQVAVDEIEKALRPGGPRSTCKESARRSTNSGRLGILLDSGGCERPFWFGTL